MTTPTGTPNDDWLTPAAPTAEVSQEPSASRRPRFQTGVKAAALVVAGLLAGGGVAYATGNHSGTKSPATGGFRGFAGQNGAGAPGGQNMPGGPGGAFGVRSGEQHVQGTVTAKNGMAVTVKHPGGTSTYTITNTTQVLRNGQPATLADVRVGDPVLVHVYPSGGKTVVERLLVGTSASDPGAAGGPDHDFGGFGQPPGGPAAGFGSPPNL